MKRAPRQRKIRKCAHSKRKRMWQETRRKRDARCAQSRWSRVCVGMTLVRMMARRRDQVVADVERQLESHRKQSKSKPAGTAIWYENSNAHAELAISEGSAAGSCGLAIGTAVSVLEECD